MDDVIRDSITLGKKEIQIEKCYLPHSQLKYYPENPRIYSIVYTGKEAPSQAEIEEKLQAKDHVKQLIQSIKANGGLIDPIIVRKGNFEVLEGNSRLAAYRALYETDPMNWSKIKCSLVSEDVDEDQVFAFLCQYHIIGRTDWKPYEQAGVIWRRWKYHNMSADAIAKEMGGKKSDIELLINVYSFMDEHEDRDIDRWSYYYEYLKSQKINKARNENSKLDEVVVSKVKSREISKAEDIRDKLKKVVDDRGLLSSFISGKKSLDDCYDRIIDKGFGNVLFNLIHRFRTKISEIQVKKEIVSMDNVKKHNCKYELKRIKKRVDSILGLLE